MTGWRPSRQAMPVDIDDRPGKVPDALTQAQADLIAVPETATAAL